MLGIKIFFFFYSIVIEFEKNMCYTKTHFDKKRKTWLVILEVKSMKNAQDTNLI